MSPRERLHVSICLLDFEFASGKWNLCVARSVGELLVDASTELSTYAICLFLALVVPSLSPDLPLVPVLDPTPVAEL